MFNNFFYKKNSLCEMMKNNTAERTTDDNMTQGHCMLDT